MLVRLSVLDDFSWQNAPDMCEVLSAVHGTPSDLLWYCLICRDEEAFNTRCDEDVYNLLDELHLDDDTSSAAHIAHLSQSPFYRVSRSMFYAAHVDDLQLHLSNHRLLGSREMYRVMDLELTDCELVVSLDVKHAKINTVPIRGGRGVGHPSIAAYPSGFTRV